MFCRRIKIIPTGRFVIMRFNNQIKNLILSLLLAGAMLIISCQKEISQKGLGKPPVAKAGTDKIITLPTDSVLLDGSASTDPDGSITEWKWIKASGPASFTFSDATISKTVAKNLIPGVYQFELTIEDNEGLSAKDTVQITVTDPIQSNRPPIANAGPDKTITLPINQTELTGSGSTDPDNNITAYSWVKISGPSSYTIVTPNTSQTQVTNLVAGFYFFELKVTDAGGLFSKDTVQIIVNSAVVPPPVGISYTFDITFDLQPGCGIGYDTAHGYYWLMEKYFSLGGNSDSSLAGSAKLAAYLYQYCHVPTTTYYIPSILMYENTATGWGSDYMKFDITSGSSNFFTLPYNNGAAPFAGTATAIEGTGRFINLTTQSTINFSGFADTTNHTGKIRLYGMLNF
jgi:hypothetical protein